MVTKIIITLSALFIFLGGLFFSTGILQLILQLFSLSLLALFMLFFTVSLFGERTPIITRYALLMGAEDCNAERIYTRKVTWIWAVFLMLLIGSKLSYLWGYSELFASGRIELLFYLGSLLLFITEFYVRQWYLPQHRGSSLIKFFSLLTQVSFKEIWLFDKIKSK